MDGCKYLELRSTPRSCLETNMTMETYVEAILTAIRNSQVTGIIVYLILSMDRRKSFQENVEIIELAKRYMHDRVVGVDICGDPLVSHSTKEEMAKLIHYAKSLGLKVTIHLAEVEGTEDETEYLLQSHPDRIGHGTFIRSNSQQDLLNRNIPLEICMTSNVFCKTVKAYKHHHFSFYQMNNHPCILCTDDKGIFNCSLSGEYKIAADTFGLTRKELFELSKRAIPFIFASDHVKSKLNEMWDDFYHKHVNEAVLERLSF